MGESELADHVLFCDHMVGEHGMSFDTAINTTLDDLEALHNVFHEAPDATS